MFFLSGSSTNSSSSSVSSSNSSSSVNALPVERVIRRRRPKLILDSNESAFSVYIKAFENGDPMDETSVLGKKFQRRFRVPYSLFGTICDEFSIDMPIANNNALHDSRIKVLVGLRFVATGYTFDTLEELSGIGQETCRRFCFKFLEWFTSRYRAEYIHLPQTKEEIEHVEGLYRVNGFPGCMGSADGVHIPWEMCPAGIHSRCKGKEGYPTIAFNVVSSHTRRVMAVSRAFYGTDNDKTMARQDDAIHEIVAGRLKDFEWQRFDAEGNTIIEVSPYFLVDGGYLQVPCFVCPKKHRAPDSDEDKFSKLVESMRKDVGEFPCFYIVLFNLFFISTNLFIVYLECTFGSLKKRFHILKHDIRLHSVDYIENIFVACCIIHNMLLDYDGWDDWEMYNQYEVPSYEEDNNNNTSSANESRTSNYITVGLAVTRTSKSQFNKRRKSLIEHFTYMKNNKLIQWAR